MDPSHDVVLTEHPKWDSHRLQLSQHCSNMALFHGVCPSGTVPALVPQTAALSKGCSCGEALHGLYLLQATSTVALWAPVVVWVDLLCVIPVAAGGWPALLWASPGLQGAAAVCLELLLHSPWCLQGCFSPISPLS